MKRFMTICALAFAAIMTAMPVMAQEANEKGYYPIPYTFIGVQGGVQNTLNNNYNNWKTFTPTAALSIGHFFSPKVGVRANFNGIWNKEAASSVISPETRYYNFNYLTSNIDVMENLCAAFGIKETYPVNVYLIGGVGLYHAWNNDEAKGLYENNPCYTINNPYSLKRNAFNGRVGLQIEANLCKNVAFNIEGTYNLHVGDNKRFARDNQEIILLAGLTFKFGYRKVHAEVVEPEPEPIYETVVDTTWYDDVTYNDVKKDGNIDKRIFYALCESDINADEPQIKEVAEFLKEVENGEVVITAYADKGTGNPRLNMQYSKDRALKTKKALIANGVDEKMIKTTEWKGDTVQPYPNDNDKNRVCIITGHGVYVQKEKVVTRKFKTSERKVRVN